jgi:hypothetical protein
VTVAQQRIRLVATAATDDDDICMLPADEAQDLQIIIGLLIMSLMRIATFQKRGKFFMPFILLRSSLSI